MTSRKNLVKSMTFERLFPGVVFFKDGRQRRCGLVWRPQWGGLLHPLTIVYRQFWFYDFAPHDLTTTHREIRQPILTVMYAWRKRRAGAQVLAQAADTCVTSTSEEIPS